MHSELKQRNKRRNRRQLHVKHGVHGNSEKPRLVVHRSNKHLMAQIIDDEKGVTLFGIGTMDKEVKTSAGGRKSKDAAVLLGRRIAEEAKKQQVERVVFDRRHYKYHGVIAALADAAREAGLKF